MFPVLLWSACKHKAFLSGRLDLGNGLMFPSHGYEISPFLLQEAMRVLKILQNLDPPICIDGRTLEVNLATGRR